MICAAGKIDCGSPRELVGYFADNLVSTVIRRFEGAHETSIHALKGHIKVGAFSFLGVNQLMAFPHRTDVTVRNRTVKCDPTETFFLFMSSRLRVLRGPSRRCHTWALAPAFIVSCFPAYPSALRSRLKE